MAIFEKHRQFWNDSRRMQQRRRRQEMGRSRRLGLEALETRLAPAVSALSGVTNDLVVPASVSPLVSAAQAGTDTAVSVSPSTLVAGQSVTLQATVTPISPGTGTPTGTVQFFSVSGMTTTPIGDPVALNGGVAMLNTSALTTADTAVTAHYGGDSDFTASDSMPSAVSVTQASTTTTLGISPNPSGFGQPVLLSAVIAASTPGSGTPTGTVEFFSGTTSLGTSTLSNGVATLTTTALPMGPNSITAQYLGDGNFSGSTSDPMTATVEQASMTSVVSAPTSVVFGQTVTLTATVAPSNSSTDTPTGSVQFFNGSSSLGSMTLSGNTATLSNVSLPTGDDSITAQYQGDVNFAASTATPITVTVAQASTTTMVTTVTPNPSTRGQQVSLTATVAPVSPGAGTPTGQVEFFNGSTSLGMAVLSGGVATLMTAALPAGMNPITAMYQGDVNFAASTATPNTATVNLASTTTLTPSATSIVAGQTITLTAAVTAADSGVTSSPTGTVDFFNGSSRIGSATLSGGFATLLNVTLPTGANMLTAQYPGDDTFAASTSAPTTVTVAQADTTTTVTNAPNPSNSGASVTLTATVAAVTPGAGTPTGSVQFFNGTTSLGTATLVSGVATISTTAIKTTGANPITAQYTGDTNFRASTSPAVTQTINPGTVSSTVTVSASPSASVTGQAVTLTAVITPGTTGLGTPTGTVQFFRGGNSLGTATISDGVATLTTTALTLGTNTITAQYSGDSTYAASTSVAITPTVNAASTTTTVTTSPNPSSLGQAVTLTATVATVSPGSGTPTGTVQFFSGTTSLGSGTLSNGVATLTTTALTPGANSITAQYPATTGFSTSTSSAVVQNVTTASPTVTLALSKADPVANEPLRFTATVAATTGSTAPTGTVDFFSNGMLIGSGTLSNGTATLTATLDLGGAMITASYEGDSNFSPATSTTTTIRVGDNNDLFLNQIYLDLFKTPIDEQGLSDWGTALRNGTPRNQVVTFIINNPGVVTSKINLQERILGPQASQIHGNKNALVNALYQAILGRQPTTKEHRAGVKLVRRTGGAKQLVINLFSTKEFYTNAFKNA